MSGEHGDGLARSVWNRKLFGPEVYAALVTGQDGLRPGEPPQSRQGHRHRRPWRPPADRPRVPPARAGRDALRLLRPGRFRTCGRDVHGRRRLPEDRHGHHVPELHGHPRRDAFDPRPGQRPPPGHERRSALTRRQPGQRDPLRGARPLPPVQGLQERMPVAGRHGQAQGRVPSQLLRRRPPSLEPPAHGTDLPAQPDRVGPRSAGQRHAPQPALQVAPGEDRGDRSPADPADVRPRPLPEVVRPPPGGPACGTARLGRAAR